MAIEDRNLPVGTRLVANYKKQTYVCTVEAAEDGEGLAFVLEDGSRYKSPSAAGSQGDGRRRRQRLALLVYRGRGAGKG